MYPICEVGTHLLLAIMTTQPAQFHATWRSLGSSPTTRLLHLLCGLERRRKTEFKLKLPPKSGASPKYIDYTFSSVYSGLVGRVPYRTWSHNGPYTDNENGPERIQVFVEGYGYGWYSQAISVLNVRDYENSRRMSLFRPLRLTRQDLHQQ